MEPAVPGAPHVAWYNTTSPGWGQASFLSGNTWGPWASLGYFQPSAVIHASVAPPTAARISAFDARWLDERSLAVGWSTGVEYDLMGFHVEYRSGSGAWSPASPRLIPAAGEGKPGTYQLVAEIGSASTPTCVRLSAVDLRGAAHVLAERLVEPAVRLRTHGYRQSTPR